MHPDVSSGRKMGSDNAIYARAAMHQRFYGNLSYLWLVKYIFFLLSLGTSGNTRKIVSLRISTKLSVLLASSETSLNLIIITASN